MAGDVANPRLWEGADLWVAPLSTAMTEYGTPMASPWESVGLLSEDGASESRDEDSSDFYAWGGKLIRTQRSKHKRTITITCLEDNDVVHRLINPGSPATTTAGDTGSEYYVRTSSVPNSDKLSFVLDLSDGTVTKRRHIPMGEVTEVGEVTLSDSEIQAYELTVTIYPDADGVLYRDYTNDPQVAPQATTPSP